MKDEIIITRIAGVGMAFGFILGISQTALDNSRAIGAAGYSRALIIGLMLSALASLVSWLARIAIVGRVPKESDPSLPKAAWAASYFLTALNFGLLCVFAPVLAASIAGWLFGWNAGELLRALIGLVLLVALFGTARDSILNLAMIANRTGKAVSRPIEPNDI